MMTSHAAFEATATAPAPSKLARPRKALMVILSIWAVVFLLAPIQVDWTDAMGGIVFFIVGAFFIWLGALHGERVRIPKVPRSARSGPQYAKAYWLALGLGCLGLLLRIYDWFFLRGLSLTGSSFDNREALEDGSGNMFSILALVLVPMVIAAYALRSSLRQDNIIIGTRLDFVL